jgi:hypothetical protein
VVVGCVVVVAAAGPLETLIPTTDPLSSRVEGRGSWEITMPFGLDRRWALGDDDRRGLTFRVVVLTREQVGGGDSACDEEEKQEKPRPDERPRWRNPRILLFNHSSATPGHHEVIPGFARR